MKTTPSRTFEHPFQSFGLKENPFQASPDPRFFVSGAGHDTALRELRAGIESHRGLLVLTGDPGTGKTTLVRHLLEWLSEQQFSTSYIFHSHLNSAGLFQFILNDFAIKTEATKKSDLLAALQRWLQARQAENDSPVVVIDEAQGLSLRALSELCLILNLENSRGKLLQIVLAGQTELDEKLRRPELRQLRQRIAVRCRLPLLSLEETENYINARLDRAGGPNAKLFPPETLQALYCYAQGVPRVTNLLCERALLAAFAEKQNVVTPGCMQRAAADFDLAFAPSFGQTTASPPQMSVVIPLAPESDVAQIPSAAGREAAAVEPVIESVLDLKVSGTEAKQSKPAASVTVFSPKASDPERDDREPADASAEPIGGPVAQEESVHFRHAPESSPFRQYWREVADSFLRDCRYFMGAFQTQSAPDGKVLLMKKYDLKRDLVAPVSKWLSKPVDFKIGRKSREGGHGD